MSLVVKQIQEKVGVTADGIWGPKTQAAVAAKLGVENMPGSIQRAVGAKVDGIIGEKTHAAILEKLGGHKEAPKSFEVKHIFVDPGHTSDYGREHPAQFTAVDWSIGKAKKVADLLGFKRETNDSIEHILNVKIAKAFTKHYGGLVCSGLFVAVLLGQLTLAGIDFLYGEPKKNGDRRDGRR